MNALGYPTSGSVSLPYQRLMTIFSNSRLLFIVLMHGIIYIVWLVEYFSYLAWDCPYAQPTEIGNYAKETMRSYKTHKYIRSKHVPK